MFREKGHPRRPSDLFFFIRTGLCSVRRIWSHPEPVSFEISLVCFDQGNAGCGLVVGVLSGADSFQELMNAGAHMVCERVTAPRHPLAFGPLKHEFSIV